MTVNKGDTVLIRDVLKCREWFANVMVAVDDVIITVDDVRFIEPFDPEGSNRARTKRVVGHLR